MSYRDLLAIRPFRNLWLGQAISQLGDALYALVFLFMVDKLTGDARMVGIAGVAQTLPFLLLSLHAGVVADRQDRRRIMLFADVASAIILVTFGLVLWFIPKPPVVALIGVGGALSLVNVFFAPAKSAAIPRLVPPEALSTANGLSMATQSFMPLIGMAISGAVLGALYAISPTYFFLSAVLLNALSFGLSAVYIRRLPPLLPDKVADSSSVSPLRQSWRDTIDGLRYMRREHVLFVVLILTLLFQFFVAPFMVVYVKVNREWFGGAYATLALCEGSFFTGMILSGIWVGRREIRRPGIAFIQGITILGLTIAAMAFSRPVGWFAFWNFVAGLGIPLAQLPMTTYIQTVVPDHFRGRVNSVLTMVSMGVQPVAIGLGGVLLEAIGPSNMLLVMGLAMAASAVAGFADRAFRTATLGDPGSYREVSDGKSDL